MSSFPGPCCEQCGISTDMLLSDSPTVLPVMTREQFNKGVALELNDLRRKHDIK